MNDIGFSERLKTQEKVWQRVAATAPTAAATSKLVFIVGSGDSAGDLLKPPSANVCLISKVAEFFSAYIFFATTYSFPQTLTQQFVDLCLGWLYVRLCWCFPFSSEYIHEHGGK